MADGSVVIEIFRKRHHFFEVKSCPSTFRSYFSPSLFFLALSSKALVLNFLWKFPHIPHVLGVCYLPRIEHTKFYEAST